VGVITFQLVLDTMPSNTSGIVAELLESEEERFDFFLYCRENMGEKIVKTFQGPKYVYIIFYACSLMLMPFFEMPVSGCTCLSTL